MRAARRSSVTDSLAAVPRISSGSVSWVTTATLTFATERLLRVRGRQQRELVGGQRPLDLGRHHERNLLSGAASEPVEERSEELPFVRVTERERPRHRGLRPAPDRNQQRVEAHLVTASGGHHPSLGIDRGERVRPQARAVLGGDVRQRKPLSPSDPEGLGHKQGTVDELRLGGEEFDSDGRGREITQGEQCLDRRDPPARDEGLERPVGFPCIHRLFLRTRGSTHTASSRPARTHGSHAPSELPSAAARSCW